MKRTYLLAFFCTLCSVALFSQTSTDSSDVQVGSILKIGAPENSSYKYIHFPKKNIIIKRGGMANYKSVQGTLVVVISKNQTADGSVVIKLKRKDGGRFFGSHTYIEADLKKALNAGEIKVL